MKLLGLMWQNEHLEGPEGELERAAAAKLMDELGGLTLAIVQAATLIKDERVGNDKSIRTFLELFLSSRRQLPSRQSGHRNALIHCLDSVWSIAFDTLTSNSRSLLGVLSLLAPDSIPLELFRPKDQDCLQGRLAFCRWRFTNDIRAQSPGVACSSPSLNVALEELRNANLIGQDGQTLVVHRVIQEAVNYHDINDLQESFDAAAQLVYEAFPKQVLSRPLFDDWPRCQMFIQHAINLAHLYTVFRQGRESPFKASLSFVTLLSSCCWYVIRVRVREVVAELLSML